MKRTISMTMTLELEDISAENRRKLATTQGCKPDDLPCLMDSDPCELANQFAEQAVQQFNDVKSSLDIDDFLRHNDIFAEIATWDIKDIKTAETDDQERSA